MTLRALLFDLDGTLADTGPDLAYALNAVRKEQARAEIPYEQIRPIVSHGGVALLKLGFPELSVNSIEFATLRQRMLGIYRDHLAVHTRPFPGMDDARRDIEAGRAAGMKTPVAMYGHIGRDDRPKDWNADGSVETPLDILNRIEQRI